MRFFTLFIIANIIYFESKAIMNIEKLRNSNKNGFTGSINLNFAGQKGNSDNSLTNLKTANSYIFNNNEYLLFSDYTYGESDQIQNAHRGNVHIRYSKKILDSHRIEFFTQTEFDDFRDLDFRQIAGSGLRSLIVNTDDITMNLGYGLFYEYENYNSNPDEKRVRANIYLSYNHQLKGNVKFSSILYLQPDVSDYEDVRIVFSPALKTKISENIAFLSSIF